MWGQPLLSLLGSNCTHKDSTTCNYLHGWEQLKVPIGKNGFNKAYLKMPNMESSPKKKFCHQHNLLTIISFRIFFFFLMYSTK